ncbi:MAG: 23S rRNA (adenine(2503)-C(2))-methyltransferase RlmN [bacterium]
MKTKEQIKNLTLAALIERLGDLGEPRFRAKQIFEWIYQKNAASFDEMSNLSKTLRDKLDKQFSLNSVKLAAQEKAGDGTRKFVFELWDGERIECVMIPAEDRLTLCVSSQAGCKLGCKFCLTGSGGFSRNLEQGEIVDQVIMARRLAGEDQRLTNLVFMGMGEPFNNYENLVKALETITSEGGLGISPRRITVSTVGIVERIVEFGELDLANLAISLNAVDEKTRTLIMPVNRRYPMAKVIAACREYPLRARDRITFEYVLLAGVNDSEENARKLSGLLKGIPCKINLIPFNEFPGSEFKSPGAATVERFRETVLKHGIDVFVRRSRGQEISAACGRLGGRPVDKRQED